VSDENVRPLYDYDIQHPARTLNEDEIDDQARVLTEQADLGADAALVLQSPAMQKAFSDIETACIEIFKQTGIRDDEGRLRARLQLQMVDQLKTNLQAMLDGGTVAKKELAGLDGRKRFQFGKSLFGG